MATTSSTCITFLLNNPKLPESALQTEGKCSFRCRRNLHRLPSRIISKSSRIDLVAMNAISEATGDVLSSLSQPGTGIQGFSLPADNPWLTAIAALLVTVPLFQRLFSLTKQVDKAAQTVEKIADTVGKVAEEVDKARADISVALQDLIGGLKKVVTIVEDIAEGTAKDAQKVEDLIDKVEEMDDKLEEFLDKQFKDTEKA